MKLSVNDLALFGGVPSFIEKLHVGTPNIGNREKLMERINDLLERRWLSNRGPFVQEFEKRIADFIGVKHCISMCNGTVALEIAIRAAGLSGEVIIPSFTFIATAHSLQWQQITPVFCDLDLLTHNMDPKCVKKMITPRTTGIIGVHLWGRPSHLQELTAIAREHNLKLLFDSAHAFGTSYNGQMIGSFGEAEVFSFHATKFFNTFEGGAVVTNSDELAAKIRLMKNFGFEDYDMVIYIGTNGKMQEISAAMGLTGLESLNDFIEKNYNNYLQYHKNLNDLPGVNVIKYDQNEKCNYQYIILEIEETTAGITRDQLQQLLWAENILARRYFYPGCHRMEPYSSYFPHAGLLLPNTELLSSRILSLPTGTAVTLEDIDKICGLIRFIISQKQEITLQFNQ